MKKKKYKIVGEEFKMNDGGESEAYCPRGCDELLRRHISGNDRYFCRVCGGKFEFKKGAHASFLRVKPERIGFKTTLKRLDKDSTF